MPNYNDLRPNTDDGKASFKTIFKNYPSAERKKSIKALLKLRKQLKSVRSTKRTNENILLASWNIREFGHLKKRRPLAYHCIAEIISSFDLVAIQEIKGGLRDLELLMQLLGSNWKYIVNDSTGSGKANREQSAYVFDTRRVTFSGLAGEITIPPGTSNAPELQQLYRNPYITGFKTGWKKFALVNLHLAPGKTAAGKAARKEEVSMLMKVLRDKFDSGSMWSGNLVLLGDFNLYKKDTDIEELFENEGFVESDLLKGKNTNAPYRSRSSEPYDRMFFHEQEYFEVPTKSESEGGVIEMFKNVYPTADFDDYLKEMKSDISKPAKLEDEDYRKMYFVKDWRTRQLSDHKPIWVELLIDSSDKFLTSKLEEYEE
ncbi:MAG: endonuclease/exonuclease/phosphatase family protein [Saprospiraceae bacterium]